MKKIIVGIFIVCILGFVGSACVWGYNAWQWKVAMDTESVAVSMAQGDKTWTPLFIMFGFSIGINIASGFLRKY
ncbi:MAG TPA: hypothetical protein ENH85_14530 [Candidatus Scalindua sp.]|nr:hypothetical protein [Candidatus Scalindua sp.]